MRDGAGVDDPAGDRRAPDARGRRSCRTGRAPRSDQVAAGQRRDALQRAPTDRGSRRRGSCAQPLAGRVVERLGPHPADHRTPVAADAQADGDRRAVPGVRRGQPAQPDRPIERRDSISSWSRGRWRRRRARSAAPSAGTSWPRISNPVEHLAAAGDRRGRASRPMKSALSALMSQPMPASDRASTARPCPGRRSRDPSPGAARAAPRRRTAAGRGSRPASSSASQRWRAVVGRDVDLVTRARPRTRSAGCIAGTPATAPSAAARYGIASRETSRSVTRARISRARGPARLTAASCDVTFVTSTSRGPPASHQPNHCSTASRLPVVVETKKRSSPSRATVPSSRMIPASSSIAR